MLNYLFQSSKVISIILFCLVAHLVSAENPETNISNSPYYLPNDHAAAKKEITEFVDLAIIDIRADLKEVIRTKNIVAFNLEIVLQNRGPKKYDPLSNNSPQAYLMLTDHMGKGPDERGPILLPIPALLAGAIHTIELPRYDFGIDPFFENANNPTVSLIAIIDAAGLIQECSPKESHPICELHRKNNYFKKEFLLP